MSRRVSTTEVERNLSTILHDVEGGESIVITSDGEDVARITPVEKFDPNSDKAVQARKALFEHLRNVKAIDIGPWTRAELYEDEE